MTLYSNVDFDIQEYPRKSTHEHGSETNRWISTPSPLNELEA